MHSQQHRRRPVVLIAVTAAVTAVLVAAAIVGLAYAHGPAKTHAGASPRTSASGWDRATLWACQAAKDYTGRLGGAGEEQAATRALGWAAESDQGALRDLAARYAATGSDLDEIHRATGATRISTWCLTHRLG